MRVEYGIDHTKHGCTAWERTARGPVKARFRNTCYVAALTKAIDWIHERAKVLREESAITGRQVEIVIPDEYSRTTETRRITLPIETWERIDAAARTEQVSVTEWIAQHC